MDKKTYEALKDVVSALHDTIIGRELEKELTQVESWIDEVAKEYVEDEELCKKHGCDSNHKPACSHGVNWHEVCEPCIPF